MSGRPGRVIEGGGRAEGDEGVVTGRKEAGAALETAASFWVMVENEEGEFGVIRYGDALLQSCLVEEMGRARKMEALGLWGDDE